MATALCAVSAAVDVGHARNLLRRESKSAWEHVIGGRAGGSINPIARSQMNTIRAEESLRAGTGGERSGSPHHFIINVISNVSDGEIVEGL